jgi:hypothetical protein
MVPVMGTRGARLRACTKRYRMSASLRRAFRLVEIARTK